MITDQLLQGRPDVDDIAIERCLSGTYPFKQLNRAERREVVAVGEQRGLTHREIARRIRISDRSVLRIAAKLREAAA